MIICPARVRPPNSTGRRQSATAGTAGGGDAEQRRQRATGGLDFGHVRRAGVEDAGRHHQHRDVDEAGKARATRLRGWRCARKGGAHGRRAGMRAWVSPECRKIACGITVAPMMPTEMSRRGVGHPATESEAAAAQSSGASKISIKNTARSWRPAPMISSTRRKPRSRASEAESHERRNAHAVDQRQPNSSSRAIAPPINSARSVAMAAISQTNHIAMTTGRKRARGTIPRDRAR